MLVLGIKEVGQTDWCRKVSGVRFFAVRSVQLSPSLTCIPLKVFFNMYFNFILNYYFTWNYQHTTGTAAGVDLFTHTICVETTNGLGDLPMEDTKLDDGNDLLRIVAQRVPPVIASKAFRTMGIFNWVAEWILGTPDAAWYRGPRLLLRKRGGLCPMVFEFSCSFLGNPIWFSRFWTLTLYYANVFSWNEKSYHNVLLSTRHTTRLLTQ